MKLSKSVQQLRELAKNSSAQAYSPYSNAKVGAAIEMSDGSHYGGCNIENSSYGGTVCAERVAVWKAVSEGHKKISRVYVYTKEGWPPCGLCRQVLSEFSDSETEVIIGDELGNERIVKLSNLLPEAFGPQFLLKK